MSTVFLMTAVACAALAALSMAWRVRDSFFGVCMWMCLFFIVLGSGATVYEAHVTKDRLRDTLNRVDAITQQIEEKFLQ